MRRIKYTLAETNATSTLDFSKFNDEAISIVAPANPLPATESVKRFIDSQSTDIQDCLRSKWGDAAFNELKAGNRLPTKEEQDKGDQCGGGQ